MCDASDYAVGAVLGQRKGKVFHAIYYASKVLNDAQLNYATIEQEMLAIVYAHHTWWGPKLLFTPTMQPLNTC